MLDQRAIVITHGVLGCVAWAIFFPLGSVLIRVLNGPSAWKVHTAIQLFSIAMFTAAVGTGLQMAKRFRLLSNFHIIIGLLLFVVVFLQSIAGYLHHIIFKTAKQRTTVSYIHLWLGRLLITLGMVNGGLGLWINDRATRAQLIAYSVIAGVIWTAWLVTSAIYEAKREEPVVVLARARRVEARERRVRQREERDGVKRKEEMFKDGGDWS